MSVYVRATEGHASSKDACGRAVPSHIFSRWDVSATNKMYWRRTVAVGDGVRVA